MAAQGSIAIPTRTIRSSSISMRSPKRRRRAPKPTLRERGYDDRQAIARQERSRGSTIKSFADRTAIGPAVIRVCLLPPPSHFGLRRAHAGPELLHPPSSQARRSELQCGRFQLVENKETMDVGSRGAEHARRQESLRRHAFGGVLARQPVPVVGQVV